MKLISRLNGDADSVNPIQKADPIARRQAILIVLISALGGFAVIGLFVRYESELHMWIVNHYEELLDNKSAVYFAAQLLLLPLMILAVYLMRFARQIIRSKRNPPPEHPLVRDMIVQEGRRAVVQGRIIWSIAWLLFFVSIALPLLMVYVFDKLINVSV